MTKRDFLAELQEALEGNLPSQEIETNIRFYDSYFRESSQSEAEVCDELGDPRLIARTLIDSFEAEKGPMADFYREQARDEYSRESRQEMEGSDSVRSRNSETWIDRLFRYIMIFAVVVIVGAVLLFVMKVAVSVVIPLLLLFFFVRIVVDLFRRF